MDRTAKSFSIKLYDMMIKKGTIVFDYPIQRKHGQWNAIRQSKLIHSVMDDFPVPSLYALIEKEQLDGKEVNIYNMLDGKQRLTILSSFMQDGFKLHKDTPNVIVDGVEYQIAGLKYSTLPEELKVKFDSYQLSCHRIENASVDQIMEMFYRLNDGVPLSSQHKNKALMGIETSERLNELMDNPFIQQNVHFTAGQVKSATDEVAVLQAMMLIDDAHELKSFSTSAISDYAIELQEGKDELFETMNKVMNTIHTELGTAMDKTILNKMHLPFILNTVHVAMNNNVNLSILPDWLHSFKESLAGNPIENAEYIPTSYKEFTGKRSSDKPNIEGRVNAMLNHFEAFCDQFVKNEPVQNLA